MKSDDELNKIREKLNPYKDDALRGNYHDWTDGWRARDKIAKEEITEMESIRNHNLNMRMEVGELRLCITEMKAALDFYAKQEKEVRGTNVWAYQQSLNRPSIIDQGDRAREVLAKWDGKV